MAKLIQSKYQAGIKAIARCEAYEDQAQSFIKKVPTQENLSLFLNGFEENLKKTLSQI